MAVSLSSGSRISRLKNSITPSMPPLSSTGNPNALCNPSLAATAARGRLSSRRSSRTQTGSLVCQTRPGRPVPFSKVLSEESFENPGNNELRQVCKQVRSSRCWLTCQSAPVSQPRPSHRVWRTRCAASLTEVDSARILVTAYCAAR